MTKHNLQSLRYFILTLLAQKPNLEEEKNLFKQIL
jgi:hypothetical protein